MTEQVRTAIIGTGGIANSHVRAIRAAGERVFLAAAMDVDADRADAFCETHEIPAKYTDAVQMLDKEQPELVHICTPPGTHCDLTVTALKLEPSENLEKRQARLEKRLAKHGPKRLFAEAGVGLGSRKKPGD